MTTLANWTERPVRIYALTDPRDGSVQYVGATFNDPEKRRRNHCAPSALKHDTPKVRWIRELLDSGLQPEVIVLEIVEPKDAGYAERRWLEHYNLYDVTHRYARPPLTYATTMEYWRRKQEERLAGLIEEWSRDPEWVRRDAACQEARAINRDRKSYTRKEATPDG